MSEINKTAPNTGLMVGIFLPEELAKKVAVVGGELPEDLHCTLAYCGRLEDLPTDAVERAGTAMAKVAAEFGPVLGLIGGVGRFNGSPSSDGMDVVHATLDAPLLPALREAVVRELEAVGLPPKAAHGFDPHITLRYEDPAGREGGAPLPALATAPVVFQALTVAAGEKRSPVQLVGTRVAKAEEMEKELSAKEQAELEAETERIRENRQKAEAQGPHPFKPAEWTAGNGHPRCLLCGDEESTSGECPGVAVVAAMLKAAERVMELEKAGVPVEAASVRQAVELVHPDAPGWLAKADIDQVARALQKARPMSREYLEEAWKLARDILPRWAWVAVHTQAMPKAGGRSRARTRQLPSTAAPLVVPAGAGAVEEQKRMKRELKVLKGRSLDDKHIVSGVVLDPYRVDAHDDWIPPDDVEETSYNWMKNSRAVTLQHKTTSPALVVESLIEPYPSKADYLAARQNQPHTVWRRAYGADVVNSGAWIIAVWLDDVLWGMYQRGEIAAYSIEGFGMRTPTTRLAMPEVTFVDLVPRAA